MYKTRYGKYLPVLVRDFREFRQIDTVESLILDEEAQAMRILENNQWIATAHLDGLLRRAEMMDIRGTWSDTEALRGLILYYWQNHSPYTYRHLLEWMNRYCGEDNYKADLNLGAYRLRIMLELCIKDKGLFLQQRLRKMIPANIYLDVDLNFNTHRKLKPYMHGQLSACLILYGGMRSEDLSQKMFN